MAKFSKIIVLKYFAKTLILKIWDFRPIFDFNGLKFSKFSKLIVDKFTYSNLVNF